MNNLYNYRLFYSSFVGYAVRLILAFIFIPYITSVYGESRYGLWVILFQIITYFSLFDFSLNSAITRFVSKGKAQNDPQQINRILNSAQLLYSLAGVFAIIVITAGAKFLIDQLTLTSPEMSAEGTEALLVMGVFIFQHFLLTAFGNSLNAFQREDISRFTILCEEIVRFVLLLYLILNGYGLVALAWSITILSFIRHLVNWVILKKLFPEVSFSIKLAGKESVKTIVAYSKISFAIAIGWMIMFNTDSFLLGLLSSTAAAGLYQPAAQMMLYLRNIVNNIGIPLIPFVSHLESQGRHEEIQDIYRKGVKYTIFLGIYIFVLSFFYIGPFITFWLPEAFHTSTPTVFMLLLMGTIFFIPQIIGNSILFACEKHSRVLIVLICEAVLKLSLAFYLIPQIDIAGMALANSLPQILLYTTLYPFLFYKSIGFDIHKM